MTTSSAASGEFIRDTNYIDDRIVATVNEPTPQADGTTLWPVAPHRYRLIAARACPWAHRSVITRRLKGLEDVISLGMASPTHDERSWDFQLDPEGVDPVLGIHRLQEAYFARFPNYPRGITVPAIVEEKTGVVVTNDFRLIMPDLNEQWSEYERPDAPDLYPQELRTTLDEWISFLFTEINNGVYRCGFATTQSAYQEAFDRLFSALDKLEKHLGTHRFIVGNHITFADIFLYVTLVRFDAVYYNHFKCNRNRIADMPNLFAWLREMYQTPGFGDTTDFQEIKEHYFIVHTFINPTQVVPAGPDLTGLLAPVDRSHLGGSPFAPGVTPPNPPRPTEEVTHQLSFDNPTGS